MILKSLLREGRLKPHQTSQNEIRDLLAIVERDINDAQDSNVSTDWRFAIAYNAALQLSIIPLYCKGYKPVSGGHHFIVFQSIKLTLGNKFKGLSDYFDSCRNKRNITEYDRSGEITNTETEELIAEVKKFKKQIVEWLKKEYPNK